MTTRRAVLVGLLSLFGQDALARKKKSGKQKNKPDKPKKPPGHTPTTTTTSPPALGHYTSRLYDYTVNYSPFIDDMAAYYASFLGPAGVDVRYIRMSPLSLAACDATTTPEHGIKLCEEPGPGGILGSSTGANWIQVGGTWELGSNDTFWFGTDAAAIMTCHICTPPSTNTIAEFILCHELGHSFGLTHEDAVDGDYSCAYPGEGYSPGTLSERHKALILERLPSILSRSMESSRPSPVCEVPVDLAALGISAP